MAKAEWEFREVTFPKELCGGTEPPELLNFVQLEAYTASYIQLCLTDDEQRAVETGIMMNPTMPPVIDGTGGIREFQFSTPQNGPGSLHLSAFYAFFPEVGVVALIDLVVTDDFGPLSVEERAELKSLFERAQEHGPESWLGIGWVERGG